MQYESDTFSDHPVPTKNEADSPVIVAQDEDEIMVDYAEPVSSFKKMFAEFGVTDDDFPASGSVCSIIRTRPRLARLNAESVTSETVRKMHDMRWSIGDIRDLLFLIGNVGFDWKELRARPKESVIIVALGSPVKKQGLIFYPMVTVHPADDGTENMSIQLVLDDNQLKWLKGNYVIVVEPQVSAATLSQM